MWLSWTSQCAPDQKSSEDTAFFLRAWLPWPGSPGSLDAILNNTASGSWEAESNKGMVTEGAQVLSKAQHVIGLGWPQTWFSPFTYRSWERTHDTDERQSCQLLSLLIAEICNGGPAPKSSTCSILWALSRSCQSFLTPNHWTCILLLAVWYKTLGRKKKTEHNFGLFWNY